MEKISVLRFEEAILQSCCCETSSDPKNWTEENPTWGHCAIVACLVQEILGGELLRFDLTLFPRFAHLRSHYKNRLPSGTLVDFTAGQFKDAAEYFLMGAPKTRSREEALDSKKYPETVRRYVLFREKFLRIWKQLL